MKDFIPQETKTTTSRSKAENHSVFEQVKEQLKATNPSFVVDASNQHVIEATAAYFSRDGLLCQKQGISPQKGLFLSGPVGCGKTSMMQFFSNLFSRPRFRLIATRDIALSFAQEGFEVLEKYGRKSFIKKPCSYGYQLLHDQPITYCFDDIGVEQQSKYFGNEVNVMAEILLDRYEQYQRYGMITHMTSNLNAEEVEKLYGERLRSRLREMFNLISFPVEAPDRRK
jgi:DNA replication protein DnaC